MEGLKLRSATSGSSQLRCWIWIGAEAAWRHCFRIFFEQVTRRSHRPSKLWQMCKPAACASQAHLLPPHELAHFESAAKKWHAWALRRTFTAVLHLFCLALLGFFSSVTLLFPFRRQRTLSQGKEVSNGRKEQKDENWPLFTTKSG